MRYVVMEELISNAVIPLKHLEFFKNMPICKGCNFKLNFNINQEYFEVTKDSNGNLTFDKSSCVNRGGGKTNPLMIGVTGMIQHTVDMEQFVNGEVIPANPPAGSITSTKTFVNNSVEFFDSVVPCGSSGLPTATYKISNSLVTSQVEILMTTMKGKWSQFLLSSNFCF